MKFSVLISVYEKDNPLYFRSALKSIWDDQTLRPNQIVIVHDGELKNQLKIVSSEFKNSLPSIVKIIQIEKNVGLGLALNIGLKYCDFDWVARMDSDDISLPNRFEKQIQFMNDNPDIDVSSAFLEEIDEDGTITFIRNLPLTHNDIYQFAKWRSPINHPLAIFRKNAVLNVGGYPKFKKSQDYALWSVMLAQNYKFANIPEVLLKMRCGKSMLKRRGLAQFINDYHVLKIQKKCGLISNLSFFININLRFFLRMSPSFLKKRVYKFFR